MISELTFVSQSVLYQDRVRAHNVLNVMKIFDVKAAESGRS